MSIHSNTSPVASWDIFRKLLRRPIAFHRVFAQITSSATAGLFLSQLFYWSEHTNHPDGWFYKTAEEWEQETTLGRREQETARKKLRALGIVEEKKADLPRKLYFRLNREKLVQAVHRLSDDAPTPLDEVTVDQVLEIYDSDLLGLSKTALMRAEKLNASREFVDYRAVLRSRGMTCGICGKPILRGPGKRGGDLSFDHRVSLDKGGAHKFDNIFPSHAFCNASKSNRQHTSMSALDEQAETEGFSQQTSMSSVDMQERLPKTGKHVYARQTRKSTVGEQSLYTEITPENTNKDYSSPLTPQGAEEKKEEGSAALLEEEKPPATTEGGQPEPSRFVEQPKQDSTQEPKILPETKVPPRQAEVVPTTTAIEPFGNQRNGLAIAKERANGFPDGEWMVDGQIDKNFLEWMGKNYLKSGWGANIHEAKRRVRGSWNNDPTRLALDWAWYTEEMGHRAANVAVQERAGISGAAVQEHKQLVEKHQRALTNPSPQASHEVAQDLIDLASRDLDPSHHPLDAVGESAALPAEPDWDAIAKQQSHVEKEYLANDAYTPQQATVAPPKDEYGQTESGDAYRAYKPAQVEFAPPPKDLLKLVNGLAEAREMKPVANRVSRRNVRAPQKSPLELLNDMLADPILRRDRSVQFRAESYASGGEYDTWRDEKGLIFKVEEIQF